jgi:hypothetical protein
MTEPNDPIDYSRPVGWWCPVCGSYLWLGSCHDEPCIPVYIPLPTPEPVEVDEVETGEAEVVSGDGPAGGPFCVYWLADITESALTNARKKRGMK